MKLRLAQIKAMPIKGDLAANHERLMALLQSFDATAVDVLITPECFLDGYVVTEDYVSRENLGQYAVDPETSSYVRAVADWAGQTQTWVIFGCTRLSTDGLYNTALILNRRGHLISAYDKTHCQTHDHKFTQGQALPVFESDFGRFGVLICADRRWPETVRTLALQGARIIFNPTYGMHHEANLWMMRTRSYESEIVIAFTHPVQSLVTDAHGQIIYNDDAPETAVSVVEVDLAEVDRVRAGPSAHLRDRRVDLYAP